MPTAKTASAGFGGLHFHLHLLAGDLDVALVRPRLGRQRDFVAVIVVHDRAPVVGRRTGEQRSGGGQDACHGSDRTDSRGRIPTLEYDERADSSHAVSGEKPGLSAIDARSAVDRAIQPPRPFPRKNVFPGLALECLQTLFRHSSRANTRMFEAYIVTDFPEFAGQQKEPIALRRSGGCRGRDCRHGILRVRRPATCPRCHLHAVIRPRRSPRRRI